MGVMNRRNAMLGWFAWRMAKRMVKQRAKAAVPAIDTGSKRPNRSAIVALLALAGGVLWFLSKRRDEDEGELPA